MSDETGRRAASKNILESPFSASVAFGQDTAEPYEFGPFRLEPAERKLSRNNEPAVLTPKAFDTLVLLVLNSGHLLEKEELIRTLWPESLVEEGNLSNNIFILRKALGEDPQYIKTTPKRGYRFVGAVRQLPSQPARHQEKPQLEPASPVPGRHADRLSTSHQGWGGIYVVSAQGGAVRKLRSTHASFDRSMHVNWSPDGRTIAFADSPFSGWPQAAPASFPRNIAEYSNRARRPMR